MTKEDFKTKLYNTISEGIKNRIKAFDFVEFIQEWSGVPYNAEDDFSKYISENKDRAQHNWDLECLSRALNFGF